MRQCWLVTARAATRPRKDSVRNVAGTPFSGANVSAQPMSSAYQGPADRLDLYDRLIASAPEIERKGATMPYTSRNGHMFSFLDAGGSMALRLPADARQEFLTHYQTDLAVQHGHTIA